ncbi:hypothetical protein AB0I53_23530 [Saccharopolyspora sp. NPDC050389]|uniref:hypothetical protein n=1 Tax=Saccharopolyspora sp. NPDC050389 TaxID=3155516 RepID=UPI003400CDB1
MGWRIPFRAALPLLLVALFNRLIGGLLKPRLSIDEPDPEDVHHTLWFSGAAKVVERLTPRQRGQLDPWLAAISRTGVTTTALDYLEAMVRRAALCERTATFQE